MFVSSSRNRKIRFHIRENYRGENTEHGFLALKQFDNKKTSRTNFIKVVSLCSFYPVETEKQGFIYGKILGTKLPNRDESTKHGFLALKRLKWEPITNNSILKKTSRTIFIKVVSCSFHPVQTEKYGFIYGKNLGAKIQNTVF